MAGMLASSTLGMGFEPVPASPGLAPWLDTSDRATVVRAYQAAFAAPEPPFAWSGHSGGCDAGTSTEAYRAATVQRVNFYRAMAGVPAVITENPDLSAKAQWAALMMSAQGELNHNPPPSFACFSPTGREAAANSNLYLGRNGPEAIDGYIEDPGVTNADVGHRDTILHPPTREMGVGDVGQGASGYTANALWVFDARVFDEGVADREPPMREADRYVAWPPRGYVPASLVHPRWSFTRAGVDVSQAEVAMYDLTAPAGQQAVPLEVVSRTGAAGQVPLPTLVWEPDLAPRADAPTDTAYLVVVTGVRADAADPAPPPVYTWVVRVMGRHPGSQPVTPGELVSRLRAG